jgi:hypothetical protein
MNPPEPTKPTKEEIILSRTAEILALLREIALRLDRIEGSLPPAS